MDSTTFLTILFICLSVIVVGHVLLKGVLGEPILRRAQKMGRNRLHPSKDELLNYVTSHLEDLDRNKNVFNPKGSNFYDQAHDSDLHSEQTNLSKYFEIEQSVPDTTKLLRELQCTSDSKGCLPEVKSKIKDNQTGLPLYFDKGSDGSLAYKPDIWKYENERVMNGGYIDGVRGSDGLQSDFAIYSPAGQTKEDNWLSSYPYTVTQGMF